MNAGSHRTHTPTEAMVAPWVSETARRPIGFAQVREDAMLDQWVVEHLAEGSAVLMVASGGCSAAALASMPQVSRLHLIDPNPAQIAISRLKLRLLATASPSERLALLGHASMSVPERRRRLTAEFRALNLPPDAMGTIQVMAEEGPDHAGRYEVLFSALRAALGGVADELTALLQLRDPAQQAQRAGPATHLGRALDTAFDTVMTLSNLVALFGEAATRNRCEPFSRHFARRTRYALASLPAADNPYLWQMLQGRFPDGVLYPWLTAAAPVRLPEVQWTIGTMTEALQGPVERFDFVHLSNILDWLDREDARSILELAWKALRPGGSTLIRQLNSSLDIEALGGRFEWQVRPANALHARDRSFFYRQLHLGRKR